MNMPRLWPLEELAPNSVDIRYRSVTIAESLGVGGKRGQWKVKKGSEVEIDN
jgi:hypothetical protein